MYLKLFFLSLFITKICFATNITDLNENIIFEISKNLDPTSNSACQMVSRDFKKKFKPYELKERERLAYALEKFELKYYNQNSIRLFDSNLKLLIDSAFEDIRQKKPIHEKFYDLNQGKNLSNHNLLHHASFLGDTKLVSLLIEDGMNVDTMDNDRKTALGYASERENLKMVLLLLEKGADVNHQSRDGQTPLYYLISRYNSEIFDLKQVIKKEFPQNIDFDSELKICNSINELKKMAIALLKAGAQASLKINGYETAWDLCKLSQDKKEMCNIIKKYQTLGSCIAGYCSIQ